MAKILRDSETVNSLMAAFRTSRVTVLKALDCKSNSELANKIRKRALDMGCRMKGEEKMKML